MTSNRATSTKAARGGAVLALIVMAWVVLARPVKADTTTVDAIVTQGSLTLTAPGSATLTGAIFNANLPSTASGSFGTIAVTDGRGLPTPWTLTASSTNFVGLSDPSQSIALSPSSPLTLAGSTMSISPGSGGVGVATGAALVAAGVPLTIATGTNTLAILGPVDYSFSPGATLVVPANTPPQTYRATVTLTVA